MHNAQSEWVSTMQMGQHLFQKGRVTEAVSAFSRAIHIQPKQAEGWANLGICLGFVGRLAESLEALDRALLFNPLLAPCHLERGKVLAALHRIDDARQALEKAVTLQRTPDALNSLANVLRVRRNFSDARSLYLEAIALAPGSSLFEVNLATCLIELRQYQDARRHLELLASRDLSSAQRDEVDTTLRTLNEFERLDDVVAQCLASRNPLELEEHLRHVPQNLLLPDDPVMARIRSYANSARKLDRSLGLGLDATLPEEWPRIEAFFMIPLVETVAEYTAMAGAFGENQPEASEWMETQNMTGVIRAVRASFNALGDPVRAESLLRLWHGMACEGLEGFLPGHFKITGNCGGDRSVIRARPDRVTGSVRQLMGELYESVPPGLPRAVLLLMGVSDIHPFFDGNGRVALTLMNRELECAGLMPAVFSRHLGFRGELEAAMANVRRNGGDVSPLLPVILEGQRLALAFCNELYSE